MNVTDIFHKIEYGPSPESNELATEWLKKNDYTINNFINGEFTKPKNGSYFETLNPATGVAIARVAHSTEEDVNFAVKSAQKSLLDWQNLDCHERAKKIYALARLIQKNSRLLAVLETLDNGKPIRETRDIDIPLVARHFYHHAGWAQIFKSEFPKSKSIGVVGQIIPWNFPLLMLAWKIAPALATGCTIILKPAEYTSITAIAFAELCIQADIPPGVVNIVMGDGSTGELIVSHPDINKIAFTGSTEVGKSIRSITAGSGKSLTLELGGKSPFIVFEDADLDSAVEGVVDAIWFNQGQVCCAGSRLLLQESISEKFIDKLKRRMETLRVGNPLDKSIDIGAIVSDSQLKKIKKLVDQSVKNGSNIWQNTIEDYDKGFYYPPTIIQDVSPSSIVAQVEIFGPVIVSMKFRTPSDAVALANNTRYGLAASIWTENINLALDIAPQIKAGVIWINSTNLFDAASGFGGYRESGFGREGGKEGLTDYIVVDSELSSPNNQTKEIDELNKKYKQKKLISNKTQASIDRTAKQFIGGKQKRSDSGYSFSIVNSEGMMIGDVSDGNRKDIRDAVEAASKSTDWSKATAHNRAQVIYFLAENLQVRSTEFANRIALMSQKSFEDALLEVKCSISRLFTYASWADKYDGNVHSTPMRNITIAMNEPLGVIGISCPNEFPLLGFISLIAPSICLGNRVVVIPSESFPLSATDFYQVIETSDVPDGVINIVSGKSKNLIQTLAEHDSIDGVWFFGSLEDSKEVEKASAGNMKQTWVSNGKIYDWLDNKEGQGKIFLNKSTQVKNIWIPYGE